MRSGLTSNSIFAQHADASMQEVELGYGTPFLVISVIDFVLVVHTILLN